MVTIAVVQCEITQYEPEPNLRKMEHFLVGAEASKVDLIVFPEDAITGPINGNRQFVDFEGKYVRHFQQLARQYAIDIVPGSIIEGDCDGWYNTTYYIDRDGTIKGKYRKVHLWHPERTYLTSGDAFPVFETNHGRVGLLICWDLIFPEAFRSLVKQGVDIVLCPSYWCFEDAGVGLAHNSHAEVVAVNALCVARAFENEIVLVFANAATGNTSKRDIDENPIGQSQIAVPFKGVLKVLNHSHEEMFIQSVDVTILKDAEIVYRIRNDIA
ncbi:MAG: carbon-nitrogen family hydrolase [Ktedonobacteraceae bacterium]